MATEVKKPPTPSAHHDQAQQHPAQSPRTEGASGVVGAQMLRQMHVQSDAAQIPNQPLRPGVRRVRSR